MEAKITRQQVARENLDMAIHVLLAQGKLASANLLAWAAIDVIKGVAAHRGIMTLGSAIGDMIIPENVGDWYRHLKEHYNYAKHAGKGPDKALEFNFDAVVMAIFEGCVDYGEVFKTYAYPMIMLKAWMFASRPEFLKDTGDHILDAALKAFPWSAGEHPELRQGQGRGADARQGKRGAERLAGARRDFPDRSTSQCQHP